MIHSFVITMLYVIAGYFALYILVYVISSAWHAAKAKFPVTFVHENHIVAKEDPKS